MNGKNFCSVYIHIPFCRRKCNYCAFYSKVSGKVERENYVDALVKEIENRAKGENVSTIYFGGGTPSILSLNLLEKILAAVFKNFEVDPAAEITIEANPGTVSKNSLKSLRKIGFNRISLGVQSFNDEILKTLGRIHDSETAIESIFLAKNFFENVGFDLMQGLPDQTIEDVKRDLKFVSELNPEHISLYELEIDEGTKFYELNEYEELNLPGEEICAEMYDLICDTLPKFGYRHYEISNFAKPGFESRHNSGYWTGRKYFGFGAAAHSYDGNFRRANVSDISTYTEKILTGGEFWKFEEIVTKKNAEEEFCFLGLRMIDGISTKKFTEKFGESIFKVYGEVIKKHIDAGLLVVDGENLKLTGRGLKLGNFVFSDFLFDNPDF